MLQRSPTYVVSAPAQDPIADWMREHLPETTAYAVTRWKNVALQMFIFNYCRRYPDKARRFLVDRVRSAVRGRVDVDTHFSPTYSPWDQRMCLVPDGDLFKSLREGRASVVTDHIETFTEKGIRLRSGQELEADLIVTATGLKMRFMGGIDVDVHGRRIQPNETMVYKGMMLSDVPNLAFAVGYTNASWTLKCDLTSEYVCRLLGHMDARGYVHCRPRRNDPSVKEVPLIDFSSGYVQRALEMLPKQGSAAPWRLYQNYALDRVMLRRGRIDDPAMEFARP